MRLTDYLDKGASLDASAPCLTMSGRTRSYAEVQRLSWMIGSALARSGITPGDRVAVLSGNDPMAFACTFGVARAGAVWCPVNPGNGAAANSQLIRLLECSCLIFSSEFGSLAAQVAADVPGLRVLVCLDGGVPEAVPGAIGFREWLNRADQLDSSLAPTGTSGDEVVMIAATGGTTGQAKGAMLTARNLETMTALTLMSYPFSGRPAYLALASLSHAAGVLCLPILTLGGEIVIMPEPDLAEFLVLISQYQVTHAFLPPALIYRLLDHPDLAGTDLSSLQCLWYGAGPMSSARLAEAVRAVGPVLGQLFGQAEAPLVMCVMAPAEYQRADGSLALERYSSAGRPTPLTTLAIVNEDGVPLPAGHRGEIVVRGPLVMAGYYGDEKSTAEVGRGGWHHTGDVGYLDADNYLYIVDRTSDVIITDGFSVYSAEVEHALLQHPAVQDCSVVGLPDSETGERVTAVILLRQGAKLSAAEVRAFAAARLDSVKAPAQVEFWADLPRSSLGKVLKTEVRARLLGGESG
jgi:acyl-CoA synthetase (AMP-forming)/AMP-acid ligase II